MSCVLIACPLAYPYEKRAVVGHLQHPVVRPGLCICEHSLPPALEKSSGNLGRREAVEQLDSRVKTRIKASGLKLRFCTNETQATREKFVKKLQGLGFDISVAEVTAPAPAACRLLKERGLRPHLLVHDDLIPEFAEIDKTNPNCVVVGDAAENFSYANVNEAFRVLIGLEKPVLISLGRGRYYKETDGLKLDVGAYMKALEYACDVEAEVVGKPAKAFFESALAEMGVPPQQAIMIGDDIVNDVGGAQQCGMRAVQVRTGKYRPCDENHPQVKPDAYVNNLAEAVDVILGQL
uniref:Phospholysine phosphohistidine inorganic pyrophosphate phosphatase n=1 Tax=Anser cygnoides TaxID=8845 RepID=A0A8B9DC96_ANSCY